MPFVALEAATLVSGTSNGITMIVFPWLVLELTGSPTAAGAIAAITALPLVVSFLFAGVAVDMLGRRRVAVVSDVLSMVSVALVPILDATVGLTFWLLAGLAVLGAVFDPAGISAREAMLPEAAEEAGLPLERANGIHEAIWGVAYLIGPGVGGLAIGVLGAAATYWLSTALFAMAALIMLLVRIPGAGRPAEHARPTGVWRSTREGVAFAWQDRVLRTVGLMGMVIVGFWLPIEGVVFPVYFQAAGQPERLGAMVMALSLGGIAGALLYGAAGHRVSRRMAFLSCMTGAGLMVVGLAVLPPFGVLLAVGLAAGLLYGPVGPIENLMIQRRTPDVLRGRIVGLLTSAAYVAGPLGYAVAGPLIEQVGLGTAFRAMALGVLGVGVAGWFLPSLHAMDDPPSPAASLEPRDPTAAA